jgi:hypothetical protein
MKKRECVRPAEHFHPIALNDDSDGKEKGKARESFSSRCLHPSFLEAISPAHRSNIDIFFNIFRPHSWHSHEGHNQ